MTCKIRKITKYSMDNFASQFYSYEWKKRSWGKGHPFFTRTYRYENLQSDLGPTVSHSTLRIRPLVCSLIGDWVKWKRASATRRIRDPEISVSLIRWTSNWHIKFETCFTPVVWRYSKTRNQTTEREKRSTSDCCFWNTGRQHSRCFIYLPMPWLRWKSHANGSVFFAHRAVLRMRKRNFRSRSFVSCWGPSHVLRVRKSVRRWVGGVSWVWQLPSQSDSDYIRKLFCYAWMDRTLAKFLWLLISIVLSFSVKFWR